MSQELWSRVDDYINGLLVQSDAALDAALADSQSAGLPAISVAPNQGKLLSLLASIQGAERILEIGTLGGYSTIWLARALPPTGRLISLELEPRHAEVARKNLARAGVAELVTVKVGPALQTLPELARGEPQPFDFVFIDADKPSNTIYLDWAIELGRPGTVIVLDNVVRDGQLANAASTDPNVKGSRGAFELIASNPRLSASALQTVGAKGYDGFAVMILD